MTAQLRGSISNWRGEKSNV